MINRIYKHNLTLLTDLYQLTMAYAYREANMHEKEAVFHLFYRKNPFKGDYAIAAGLDLAIDYLKQLKFEPDDIQYLGSLKGNKGQALFNERFLNFLQRFEFQCDIDAVPEGTMVFPHQPLLRVKGPLWQCQLIETALLNIINFSTLIATKSSRIVAAAQGESVLEFGLRRAQGIDGALSASRASYIGGCHATSNVLAGKLFQIPVKGTHAHSWVMCFENELESFETYAKAMPDNCTFLVDTFDTVEGVKKAVKVAKKLRKRGYEMNGIRLDSGDLADLSIKARKILDKAGFSDAKIVASNDLDEYRIKELKEKGAKITVWGVGTRLATSFDQPALGGVYKLAAIKNEAGKWDYKIKLSEQAIKTSNPGILSTKRFFDTQTGLPIGDVIYDLEMENTSDFEAFNLKNGAKLSFDFADGQNLLQPVFKKGKLVYLAEDIHIMRERTLAEMDLFSKIKLNEYPIALSKAVHTNKQELRKILKK